MTKPTADELAGALQRLTAFTIGASTHQMNAIADAKKLVAAYFPSVPTQAVVDAEWLLAVQQNDVGYSRGLEKLLDRAKGLPAKPEKSEDKPKYTTLLAHFGLPSTCLIYCKGKCKTNSHEHVYREDCDDWRCGTHTAIEPKQSKVLCLTHFLRIADEEKGTLEIVQCNLKGYHDGKHSGSTVIANSLVYLGV